MNPFRGPQPPTIIVKQEKPPSIMDYACACGCGIPVVLMALGLVLSGLGFGG